MIYKLWRYSGRYRGERGRGGGYPGRYSGEEEWAIPVGSGEEEWAIPVGIVGKRSGLFR